MSPRNRLQHAKRRLDDLIRRSALSLGQYREFFWRLIHTLRGSSQLLIPSHGLVPGHWRDSERFVSASARVASYCIHWLRDPEAWTAPTASPFIQFRSLVNHLFARYPVPSFMTRIWLLDNREQEWERQLYFHLARGLSVRQFAMPFPWRMSKSAARFFIQAPDDLYPIEALRWAHVRYLGGNDRLARCLFRTVLAAPTDHEEFWETVIRFLIKHDPLPAEDIRAIVSFLHGQKFRPADLVWGAGAGSQPLQPDFSLERHSLASLRRHMTHWRAAVRLPQATPSPKQGTWPATFIKPFCQQEGDDVWTIQELLTDQEVRAEGGIMQHCVASYIHVCARRQSSIWSMQVQRGETRKHTLTIEVLPETRTIRQAKGKRNAPPSDIAKVMIHRWAAKEGLRFENSRD